MHEHRQKALRQELAAYRTVLREAMAKAAGDADAAKRYELHIGAVAQMDAALGSADAEAFERLVRSEIRAFGWSYLPGKGGARAETAWNRFCRSTGIEY